MTSRVTLFNDDKNNGKDITSIAGEPSPFPNYYRNRLSHMCLQMCFLHSYLKYWYH